ncbi:hypothetical protein [Pelagibacterium sp.]|uniref:hypothetical protein n=1 Tax=Pelagibacterium sp. TaxID=1967288 RepID=UPI003BA93C77
MVQSSPPRGVHHDPWLIGTGDLEKLAQSIFDTIEQLCERPKRQWQDATYRRRLMVDNIVANMALLVAYHPEGTHLAVSAKNTKRSLRYDREAFSRKALMHLIREMEELELLTRIVGTKGVSNTLLRPAGRLLASLEALPGVPALGRVEGAESIILKAYAGKKLAKIPIEYEDTPESLLARDQMGRINRALNAADITFDGKPVPPIFLKRHFQIESVAAPHTFDRHGRLYHGLWESLAREDRHRIRIDGQQVAEIDFAGMFVHLAYAEAGLEQPEGDPYEGLGSLTRKAAKIAFSTLISKEGPLRQLPDDLTSILPAGIKPREVTQAILSKHHPVAHLFGKRVGMRLMYVESEIMVSTLLKLIEQDRIALPLHDGLLVNDDTADLCEAAMREAGRTALGREIPVSRKPNLKCPPNGRCLPSRCL